ncbi:MAG: PIG-L family deacetylase [Armatimonadetes bacterium]|nr:PIG-L family deacetylase [Armatimonadota bacterium]
MNSSELCFDPDPSHRWLFCMAHPDDEMAISGWIHRLTSRRIEVWLSWTHSTPEREEEALHAARVLGVPPDRLVFHRAGDGTQCDELQTLFPNFLAMESRIQPTRVATVAFEQGHPDHDATHLLVRKAFPKTPVLEWPMYHAYIRGVRSLQDIGRFADPGREEALRLDPDERKIVRAVVACHKSQPIMRNVWAYQLYRLLTLRPVSMGRKEFLRWVTHGDYLQPSLPPSIARAVEETPLWNHYKQCAQSLLASLAGTQ